MQTTKQIQNKVTSVDRLTQLVTSVVSTPKIPNVQYAYNVKLKYWRKRHLEAHYGAKKVPSNYLVILLDIHKSGEN